MLMKRASPGTSRSFEGPAFVDFFGPKGFPPEKAHAFNAALRKTLAHPEVQDKIRPMALEPAPITLVDAARQVDVLARFWKPSLGGKSLRFDDSQKANRRLARQKLFGSGCALNLKSLHHRTHWRTS
jgi:hypothetical protein